MDTRTATDQPRRRSGRPEKPIPRGDLVAIATSGIVGLPTEMGIVKMPPDATQGDLVYDQRV